MIPDTVSQSTSTTSIHRVLSSKHVHAPPAHSRFHRDLSVSARRNRIEHPADSPMLMFSVDALFLDAQKSPSQHPKPIHQCLQPTTRVINTLMRLVHGGVRVRDGIRTMMKLQRVHAKSIQKYQPLMIPFHLLAQLENPKG